MQRENIIKLIINILVLGCHKYHHGCNKMIKLKMCILLLFKGSIYYEVRAVKVIREKIGRALLSFKYYSTYLKYLKS